MDSVINNGMIDASSASVFLVWLGVVVNVNRMGNKWIILRN